MAEPVKLVERAFTAYTVERELGSGGMATVYLAHDKKHDRRVAIKILHAELAAALGAERFLQEIRVTANLQHPHILGLIDSGLIADDAGEFKGRPYYVMPYIEGESLRERLDREQQLPVSDSVRIATQAASALDYAHRHGVIHRDIKPENILLHDGSAIVADFGIALAVTQAGGARMTQSGVSLGTPSYMSPEQASGERAITARSDIFSLGAVTYEMLSGEPPFTGPTVQAIVARIMTEEPRPLTAQRRKVPQHIAAAVSQALEKVPADRFASAKEFADALNNPSFTRSATSAAEGMEAVSGRLRGMLYAATALAIVMTGAALWGWMRPSPSNSVVRYNLALDSAETIALGEAGGFTWGRLAISPDGSRLAYIGGPRAQLLIRPRNQLHATPIPGTDAATTPFFSPDGGRVGFLRARNVSIASMNGGTPITVSDSLTGVAGASWGRDGVIYVDGEAPLVGLFRLEAKQGARPKQFTTLDTAGGEVDHTFPDVLPNGKGVLFTDIFEGKNGVRGRTTYAVAVADIPSGKHRVVVDDAAYPRYAATGHLLYVTTNRTLMVVPFDQNTMKVTGEPTAVVEGMRLGDHGSADVGVSEAGTLVYATAVGGGWQELVWVERDGKARSVDPDWQGHFWSPSLSPNGKQLAVVTRAAREKEGFDIWIKNLDRGPSIRLTHEGSGDWYFLPSWTADGRAVTFNLPVGSSRNLWTKGADGSAQAALQLHERRGAYQPRWSSDGKWLLFITTGRRPEADDILGIRPGIDTTAVSLVATKFSEASPVLSPDGRWLAYTSNESGQYEIYVVPFPNTAAGKWAVSTRGGAEPLWSHRGSELFYRAANGDLVAVDVKSTPTLSLGRSTALFSSARFSSESKGGNYAVSPDDQRFLMIRPVDTTAPDQVIVVDNWFEELKEKSRK